MQLHDHIIEVVEHLPQRVHRQVTGSLIGDPHGERSLFQLHIGKRSYQLDFQGSGALAHTVQHKARLRHLAKIEKQSYNLKLEVSTQPIIVYLLRIEVGESQDCV